VWQAELAELFKDFGTMVECHIPKLKADFGFVEYASSKEASDAVETAAKKELTIRGNRLRVRLSQPKAGESQGSEKLPGQQMTQAERIATYGIGTGYLAYSDNRDKRAGDQRVPFDKSMIPTSRR